MSAKPAQAGLSADRPAAFIHAAVAHLDAATSCCTAAARCIWQDSPSWYLLLGPLHARLRPLLDLLDDHGAAHVSARLGCHVLRCVPILDDARLPRKMFLLTGGACGGSPCTPGSSRYLSRFMQVSSIMRTNCALMVPSFVPRHSSCDLERRSNHDEKVHMCSL